MLARLDLALGAGLTQFAELVTYQLAAGGAPFEVEGVWRAPHQVLDLGGAPTEVSTTSPSLGVRLEDFPSPPLKGDTFVQVGGATWKVIDVLPDGPGLGARLAVHQV